MRLLTLLLTAPTLLVTTAPCLAALSFVVSDFDLEACPDATFELAQRVSLPGWSLHAEEKAPYCHGWIRYELEENHASAAFAKPVDTTSFYARLVPGRACRLQIITDLSCEAGEQAHECISRLPYPPNPHSTEGKAPDFALTLAQRLLLGQSGQPKSPASKRQTLGSLSALASWCRKP